jgi:16S rRNA (cytidine1402-2'-O)-methyltransferase
LNAAGRLVVCPTPIGNLDDVTPRVLEALRTADVVACEDTRHTRVLLDRYGIRAAALMSYHEHNERARASELVSRVSGGEVVALVSDAGMPAVSDPGWVVVRACAEAGLRVEVLPGPSAVDVALVASALPAERWMFVGFLPRRASELAAVWESEVTVVAFESPRRLAASLASLAAVDAARPVAVCRELTKVHEEVVRGTAGELAARFGGAQVRGEIVLVVGPAAAGEGDSARAVEALRALVDAGARARPAAAVVARLTGVAANRLYREVSASSARRGRSGD